jgi:hypothetical protein
MTAEVKLTAYDKQTELLTTAFALPQRVVGYARRVAGVPETDPSLLGVYPLTQEQADLIARRASLSLDLGKFDFCLESFAPDRAAQASAA